MVSLLAVWALYTVPLDAWLAQDAQGEWLHPVRASSLAKTNGWLLLVFDPADEFDFSACSRVLRRVARREKLAFAAFSSSSLSAVARFVREQRQPRMPVAAGSRAAEVFQVSKTPAFVLLRSAGESPQVLTLSAATELAEKSVHGAVRESANSSKPPSEFELGGGPGVQQQFELLDLWDKVGPTPEFLAFCEDQRETETKPHVQGALEYILAVAAGEERGDRDPSPAGLALYAFKQDRKAEGWRTVQQFVNVAEHAPVQDLQDAYFGHMDQSPHSLVIRFYSMIGAAKARDCGEARELQLFAAEFDPDQTIRQLAVQGLAASCHVGDLEASETLSRLSFDETNWLYTRPAMQAVARYLRSGSQSE